jgi:hypothetical protein
VPSLDYALRELQLEPVHRPFRAIFADGLVRAVLDGAATATQLDELERRYADFLTALAQATGITGDPVALAAATRSRTEGVFRDADLPTDDRDRAALLVWLALARTGELAAGADVAATSEAWFDELRLPGALAAGLHEAGFDEGGAWAVADLVRVLLALPRPSTVRGPARSADGRLLERWLARAVVRTAIGLNTWQGVDYVDRDAFTTMLRWAVRLDAIEAGAASPEEAVVTRLSSAAEESGYRVDRLREALAPRSPGETKASVRRRNPTSGRRPPRS